MYQLIKKLISLRTAVPLKEGTKLRVLSHICIGAIDPSYGSQSFRECIEELPVP